MHREITYILEDENSIKEALRGFLYSYLDLKMPYEKKYNFEITEKIRNDFKEKFKSENSFDFLAWISYQLQFMEIQDSVKFKFLQKMIEFLGSEVETNKF